MRVTLVRNTGEGGRKLSDDIFGDLDPTSGDGWFDPTMIMIHADPGCSENPEGDILMFDSVNGKLSLWVERHEFYAQFDGEWRLAMDDLEAKEKEPIRDDPGSPIGDPYGAEDRLGDCCVNPACDGIYKEMSIYDDWAGRVTCSRCNDRPLRWRR